MYRGILILIVNLIILTGFGQEIKVIKGHAHNDYENENPLLDALENGFLSIEADIHLVNDKLYVSHDFPNELNPDLTLEALYLDPLKDHIAKNNGLIYKGYSGPVYLMIDFKSAAKPTYRKLKEVLSDYRSMLSVVENGVEQNGPLTVLISGNRPVQEILNDEPKMVRLDGRPNQLNKNIPPILMPVVSDRYSKILSWDGTGEINEEQEKKFNLLVQNAHTENKKLRLWGLPDNETVWKYLLDHGMDLINTDHLEEFRTFYLKYDVSCN
jgi:hypothetical protein